MSLMSRVSSVQSTGSETTLLLGNSSSLDELKSRLQANISPARMAAMIDKNPGQARSEIRLVCNQILDQNPWLATGDSEREELIVQVLDSVFGFGPLEDLLSDEDVTEIMVNGTSSLYYEKGGVLFEADRVFTNDEQVLALIDKIVGPLGRRIDESSPMVNARLAQGHRVNAIIPPLAIDGPVVTIRKFRSKIYSLSELLKMGSFDDSVMSFMRWAVLKRCNVAVSGGTGSGKTTLLNALSCEIPYSERIITIEDSAELRFLEHPHVVRLESRAVNTEGVGEVSIRDLVINSLRMRPDRIVVGECRGAEALDMLQAMNTGHDGSLTTLHANSPVEAVSRLTTMVRYAVDLPVEVIENQVASAIDVVIQTTRSASGKRFVSQIVGYEFEQNIKRCVCNEYYSRPFDNAEGVWTSVPSWLEELPLLGIVSAEEVQEWKRRASLVA